MDRVVLADLPGFAAVSYWGLRAQLSWTKSLWFEWKLQDRKCDCVSCLGHRETILHTVVLQAKSLKEVPVPALLVKICHLSTRGPWRYRFLILQLSD